MVNIKSELKHLWLGSPSLTGTCLLMLAVLIPSAAGIFLDSRIIMGVPAWLKPAKFALSTAIFSGTLAWLFRYLTVWPRFVRTMGWVIASVIVLEVGIIDVQAARGTTSHFNASSSINRVLFIVMGSAIGILWLASVGLLAAIFWQRFADPAWGWALRLGMLINVLGAAAAGFMLGPTPAQMEALKMHRLVTAVGGHTVGGLDGGPGLPGTGWSTEHGDLRVPHFFGLHALQAVPLLFWVSGRRRTKRLAFAVAGSYLALTMILAWQALRGESIVQPHGETVTAMGVWLAGTVAAVLGA